MPTPVVPKDTARVNFWLKKSWYRVIKEVAESQNCSASDIIRQAILEYLRKLKAQREEQKRAD